MRDGEILYYILTPLWPWTRFTLLLTISFYFFSGVPGSGIIKGPGIQCAAQQPSQNLRGKGRPGRCWRYSALGDYTSSGMCPLMFLSHVSKCLVLGQNRDGVRPRLPDSWFFPSNPACYKKTLQFYLSRKPSLLWQPNRFPEWGKKKKAYFEPFLWNTYALALFLNNVKENWENSARNLSCPFLVYLQCGFVSFQNS